MAFKCRCESRGKFGRVCVSDNPTRVRQTKIVHTLVSTVVGSVPSNGPKETVGILSQPSSCQTPRHLYEAKTSAMKAQFPFKEDSQSRFRYTVYFFQCTRPIFSLHNQAVGPYIAANLNWIGNLAARPYGRAGVQDPIGHAQEDSPCHCFSVNVLLPNSLSRTSSRPVYRRCPKTLSKN
jgi:hypothetical protein